MNIVVININLLELANIEEMTVRSYNILKYSGLTSLKAIMLHYNENGDFKKLRNCGNKTNNELINICLKYKDYLIVEKNEPSSEQKNEIKEEVKDELKEIIDKLNFIQKTILNSFIKSLANNLSIRSYNALDKLLNKTFTVKNLYTYIFEDKYFDFKNVRNVGGNSIQELNQFKKDILEYIKVVSLFENEEDLQKEYYNSLLTKHFQNIDIHKFNNFCNKKNEIQIFNLLNQLIENELIFKKRELIIFQNAFNYFIDDKIKLLEDVAPLIDVTRERTRQLRNKIFDELDVHLKFITSFEIDFNASYNINTDANLITIKNEIIEKINKEEKNKFNKLFVTKIISIFHGQTHELIGREYDLVFNTDKRFVNDWKTTYLIKRKLTAVFDFEKFADDIFNRLNDRIINSYSFHFQSYLLKFLKSKDYTQINKISPICEICEQLIFEEFGLVIDIDENIVFQRNIPIQNWVVAKEILEDAQEPLNLKEIYQRLVKKYPNYETTINSIGGAMRQSSDFIYFGRTSTYGLKVWEEKYSDIKGGTIRDIVEEFLNKHSEPKHIDDITEYVCKYRKTNVKNIYSNIRMEENNRFLFFENNLVGLKSKQNNYSLELSFGKSYNQRTWVENFSLLQKFVAENKEFPRSYGGDEEQKLYRFCSVNRTRFKKGLLSESQINELIGINFPFQLTSGKIEIRKSWFESYYSFRDFIKTNNREPLSRDIYERNLYYWKRRSVKDYHDNKLSNKQIELLREINLL